jgi:hypothetical protein
MKRKLFCLLTFFMAVTSFGQDNTPKEMPMAGDNATALQNAVDIPVSLFTGQANINVPLTKIKNGPIEVDVSLNYDSNGVKVASKPTWVGLNWFLDAGGVITRKENVKYDEFAWDSLGYLNNYTALSPSNWDTRAYLNTLTGT